VESIADHLLTEDPGNSICLFCSIAHCYEQGDYNSQYLHFSLMIFYTMFEVHSLHFLCFYTIPLSSCLSMSSVVSTASLSVITPDMCLMCLLSAFVWFDGCLNIVVVHVKMYSRSTNLLLLNWIWCKLATLLIFEASCYAMILEFCIGWHYFSSKMFLFQQQSATYLELLTYWVLCSCLVFWKAFFFL